MVEGLFPVETKIAVAVWRLVGRRRWICGYGELFDGVARGRAKVLLFVFLFSFQQGDSWGRVMVFKGN